MQDVQVYKEKYVLEEEVSILEGLALLALGENLRALSIFDEVLAENPRHYGMYFNKALCFFNLNEKEKALKNLKDAYFGGIGLEGLTQKMIEKPEDFLNMKLRNIADCELIVNS